MIPTMQASRFCARRLATMAKTGSQGNPTNSRIQQTFRCLSSLFEPQASPLARGRLYSKMPCNSQQLAVKRDLFRSLPPSLRVPFSCSYSSDLSPSDRLQQSPKKPFNSSPRRIPVNFTYNTRVCYSKTAQENGRGRLISFDYAVKFLLKNKEGYSVVENFLSALLEKVGYPKIKIIGVRDPENQKSFVSTKITIPDILVEDETGKRYLVEIERDHFADAVYKANYNTSYSTIHDFLDSGDKTFSKIRKVVHISILYDNYRVAKDYLYHGKIEPKGVNDQSALVIYKHKNRKKYNTVEDLPEYFFVFPDNFHETFKDKFDEWMNLLKSGEVREEALETFSDFKDVEQRMSYLNLTEEERLAYDKDVADRVKREAQLEDKEEMGKNIGRAEGKQEVAQTLFKQGVLTADQISEATGLSPEEVRSLQKP